MKLDKFQRLVLANQMTMLATLKPEDARYYAHLRTALERGYESEYHRIVEWMHDPPLSESDCDEVNEILAMFDALQVARSRFGKLEGIDDWQVEFIGFDGNYEPQLMAYASYVCESDDGHEPRRYVDVTRKGFNSHAPRLAVYRRQLKKWREARSKPNLSEGDYRLIASAARAPS